MSALTDFAKNSAASALGISGKDNRYRKSVVPLPIGSLVGKGIDENVMNFRFVVWIESKFFAFQSISGLGTTHDYQYLVEGGNNNFPRALKASKSQPEQLTFKRGYRINKVGLSALYSGLEDKMPFKDDSVAMIFVLDRRGSIQAMYSFITMGLTKWQVGDLDAQKGQPLIETFTINHRGITNVPVPWLNWEDNLITGIGKAIIDDIKTAANKNKKSKVSTDKDGNKVTTEENYTKTDYNKPVVDMTTGQKIVVKSKKVNKDGTIEYTDTTGKVTKYNPATGETTTKDSRGNTVVTDKDGNVKTYKTVQKDVNGVKVDTLELVKESNNGKVTEFNNDGTVKTITDEKGAVTTFKDGKPDTTVQKNGAVTKYYDDYSITKETNGCVTKQDKNGNEITMDAQNKIVKTKTVTPDGGYIEEKNGITTQVDGKGNKTVKDKDGNILEEKSKIKINRNKTDRGNTVTRDEKGNVTNIN